jgi:hypothetical protein
MALPSTSKRILHRIPAPEIDVSLVPLRWRSRVDYAVSKSVSNSFQEATVGTDGLVVLLV